MAIPTSQVKWPDGKAFAFTIFDDTDYATLENVRPVYDLLTDLGFRTTKSVWPIAGPDAPSCGGVTCEDPNYLAWLQQLQQKGHEIGYHMATYHTSEREQTIEALDRFAAMFNHAPKTMANHSACRENIYWGSSRLSGANRFLYNVMTRYRQHNRFRGHVKGDPLFWGDMCSQRITYVRNFVYPDINTLAACPVMPYHDPDREYVPFWYASSEGPEIQSFNATLAEPNQDRLVAAGGACIMYTHLACGFVEHGDIDSRFRRLMTRLSKLGGWFVPAGTLLDFLRQRNGGHIITDPERRRLERSWLRHKLRVGAS